MATVKTKQYLVVERGVNPEKGLVVTIAGQRQMVKPGETVDLTPEAAAPLIDRGWLLPQVADKP